nr:zinc finger protein [Hymenolepis microstoma]
MIQLLRVFLTSTNTPNLNLLQSTVNSFNFSFPISLPPLPTYAASTFDMKRFAPPNIPITNSDCFPPKSISGTNGRESPNSFTVSNHGSNSSTTAFRPLSMVSSRIPCRRRYFQSRRFVCNQCRMHFSSVQPPKTFAETVKELPFTCNVCSRGYCRKDHLVRHIESVHPNVDPRLNITTHLHSSECLEFLEKSHLKLNVSNSITRSTLNGTNHGSVNSPATSDEELMLTNEVSALLSVAQEGTDRSIDQIIEQSSYQPLKK